VLFGVALVAVLEVEEEEVLRAVGTLLLAVVVLAAVVTG
jgi:hypothetical protein